MSKATDKLQKGELYVRIGGMVQKKKITDLAGKDLTMERRLEAITHNTIAGNLVVKSVGNSNPAENFFIGKSPVSGLSAFAKSGFNQGDFVMSIFEVSQDAALPYIAAALLEESLKLFVKDEKLRSLCATHSVNLNRLTEGVGYKANNYIFTANRKIEEGEILTQDYIYMGDDPRPMINWVRTGVAPELMQKDGTAVPGIDGNVYTLYISGIKSVGDELLLDAIFINPKQYKIDPNQDVIGKSGTTLFAYDRRLFDAYAKEIGNGHNIIFREQVEALVKYNYPPQLVEVVKEKEAEQAVAKPEQQPEEIQSGTDRNNLRKLEQGFAKAALERESAQTPNR
ncbi:MAG: hypothetical protein K0R98_1965 [Rickettsiaceae bacterium]|jgi:hypothetical protein|nr:hypothetical protein [Rickettsiaceae bacterium]